MYHSYRVIAVLKKASHYNELSNKNFFISLSLSLGSFRIFLMAERVRYNLSFDRRQRWGNNK